MTSIPASIYRSMLRISRKNDSQVKKYLKTGLLTFEDNTKDFYDYKYIREDKVFFVCGPYSNETTNMLSYTKCMIRNGLKTNRSIERLFLAHRELPNFFIAKKIMENKDNALVKAKQNKKFEKPVIATSFGTTFY